MQYNRLSEIESYIIESKGTEPPFSGEYVDNKDNGNYYCKKCNALLFSSNSKFDSRSGWPSFDDELNDSVEKILDRDGYREEIICKNCKGHLGHIFYGEGFTAKNQRYCVNSLSLKFKKS
jgi:methionine-R-sulfoxide reductase